MDRKPKSRDTDKAALAAAHGDLCIELGRTWMSRDAASRLGAGSVVELDKRADDPVDVVVGGRLVARGQLIVLAGNLCVRVCELVAVQQAA